MEAMSGIFEMFNNIFGKCLHHSLLNIFIASSVAKSKFLTCFIHFFCFRRQFLSVTSINHRPRSLWW